MKKKSRVKPHVKQPKSIAEKTAKHRKTAKILKNIRRRKGKF